MSVKKNHNSCEEIMEICVDQVTYDSIISDIPNYLYTDKKMTAISVNPQIILEGQKYPEIVNFVNSATHRIPDGIGIVLVSKLFGGKINERVAGIELMMRFLEYANRNHLSAFFYGAKPTILKDALSNINRDFPNLKITGGIDGYTELKEEEIVKQINKTKPNFLFVALGFPKQEEWLSRNISKIDASIFQDVGGSLDVISGHVKRAPNFFIKTHTEWLYRSLSNPKRIGRIFQLPIFLIKSILWKLKN